MAIRYDFWSLIQALEAGLTHGGESAGDFAKSFADAAAKLSETEQQAKVKQLGLVAKYLRTILQEMEARDLTADQNADTVALPVRPWHQDG